MSAYFPLHRAYVSNNVWICLIAFLSRIPRQRTPEVYIKLRCLRGEHQALLAGRRHVIRG